MADNLSATLCHNLECTPKELAGHLAHPIDRAAAIKPLMDLPMELTYGDGRANILGAE